MPPRRAQQPEGRRDPAPDERPVRRERSGRPGRRLSLPCFSGWPVVCAARGCTGRRPSSPPCLLVHHPDRLYNFLVDSPGGFLYPSSSIGQINNIFPFAEPGPIHSILREEPYAGSASVEMACKNVREGICQCDDVLQRKSKAC